MRKLVGKVFPLPFERADAYEKGYAVIIICSCNARETEWRYTRDEERYKTPTRELKRHLEDWVKLPIKVSPDFKPSRMVVLRCK